MIGDDDMNNLPMRRPTVCDLFSDLSNPHGIPNTIDKIVAVQVFEHFSPAKAIRVLQAWHDDLKHGRPLVMSVPDTIGTLALMKTDHDFAMRHMLGRNGGSDKYQSHWAWYTQDTLIELLQSVGFRRIDVLPNFHFYPALVVRAVKA